MTMPNQNLVLQGLRREDLFTVVMDQVLTDTARFADVVLPATTFLERTELSRGYGAFALQLAPAVIPPVGESRPNHEVFADLCRRTGVARPGDAETTAELTDALFRSSRTGDRMREGLARDGVALPASGWAPVQFVDVFPRTPDRKVHLVAEELDREAPQGLYGFRPDPARPEFPLSLISPATDRTISSTLGELTLGDVALEMHPADAEARRSATGRRCGSSTRAARFSAGRGSSRGCGPASCSCPRGSGATTHATERRRPPWLPTRSRISEGEPASTTPGCRSSGTRIRDGARPHTFALPPGEASWG